MAECVSSQRGPKIINHVRDKASIFFVKKTEGSVIAMDETVKDRMCVHARARAYA